MKCLALILAASTLAAAEAPPRAAAPRRSSLERRIEAIIGNSPALRRAFWGIEVVQLSSGRRLFESNPQKLFTPASNTKLFTTALALMRLGPDFRFETLVTSDARPEESGRLRGDLRFIGGGDPMLSARVVPYQRRQPPGNPLQTVEELADQAYASGVRRIDGDIIGDDTAFVWEPYPEGWAQDDLLWDFGAPVSALTVNDNVFWLRLKAVDGTAAVSLSPPLEFYSIDNRVRVGPGLTTKVRIERLPGGNQLRLWGSINSDPPGETQALLAIHEPALYAARALADALARRGVAIAGRPVARHRFANQLAPGEVLGMDSSRPQAPGVVLARRTSPPLVELLRIIDKVSQNLHAEMVLRQVARTRRGSTTREAGLEEERVFLRDAGILEEELQFSDGSGLSGMNLVSPEALVKLLRYMERGPYRDAWISLLPVGAEDGTLWTRFENAPSARRIHAKTGSLSHVAALSGYIDSRTRGRLAFSILVNNFNGPGAEIRQAIDRIGLLLAD